MINMCLSVYITVRERTQTLFNYRHSYASVSFLHTLSFLVYYLVISLGIWDCHTRQTLTEVILTIF